MPAEKQAQRGRVAIIIAGISVIAIFYFFNPVSLFFPKCPVYISTGFHCTGCGSQRALHALLNGHITQAWQQNMLATLCYLALLCELIAVIINPRFRPSALLQKKNAAAFVLCAVVLFTILRNIPAYPFTLLAPYTHSR